MPCPTHPLTRPLAQLPEARAPWTPHPEATVFLPQRRDLFEGCDFLAITQILPATRPGGICHRPRAGLIGLYQHRHGATFLLVREADVRGSASQC